MSSPDQISAVTYTTAPADYDGFGTITVGVAGATPGGKTIRKVQTPQRHVRWQRMRYASGLCVVLDEAEYREMCACGLVEPMIQIGDIIEFTPRWETEPVRGVVVKHTIYPRMRSANTIVVFVHRLDGSTRNLFQMPDLPASGFSIVDPASDDAQAEARLAQAKERYRAHLSQFPAWRERFEQGGDVTW